MIRHYSCRNYCFNPILNKRRTGLQELHWQLFFTFIDFTLGVDIVMVGKHQSFLSLSKCPKKLIYIGSALRIMEISLLFFHRNIYYIYIYMQFLLLEWISRDIENNIISYLNIQIAFTKVIPTLKQKFLMSLISWYLPRTLWAATAWELIIMQLYFDCDCQNCRHWELGNHSKNVFEKLDALSKWIHAERFEIILPVLRACPDVWCCCAWANLPCWRTELWNHGL